MLWEGEEGRTRRLTWFELRREVNRLHGMPGLPFVVLSHIHEHNRRISGQPFARLVHGDFFHAQPRFIDQPEESGRMFHEPQNSPALISVN